MADSNCEALCRNGNPCNYKGKEFRNGVRYCGIHVKVADRMNTTGEDKSSKKKTPKATPKELARETPKESPRETPGELMGEKSKENVEKGTLEDVDIFDFKKYPRERELFAKHFDGIELYLRLASFIDYKYNYNLTPKERDILDLDIEGRANFDEINDFLKILTDVFEIEGMLIAWYRHFNLDKLDDIDDLLRKYVEGEDYLFNRLYRKYIDPEWGLQPLWFVSPPFQRPIEGL